MNGTLKKDARSAPLNHTTVKAVSFEAFTELWTQTRQAWPWPCLFMLPFWLENVCRHLGAAGDPHILTVYDDHGPIGSMPLAIDGASASFLGAHEVCDYQDLICAPGKHRQVLQSVLTHIGKQGVRNLDLRTLRPDARLLEALAALSNPPVRNEKVPDEATYETALPDSWEGYLRQLDGKQRHEVRRKLRRLENHGRCNYRCIANGGDLDAHADSFLALFRRNRPDKAAFMTGAMESYFRDLIRYAADRHMLRLCFLDIEDRPAASVLCFDYRGTRYLYNSGYDEQFESLSVGVLSKVMSVRNAVEAGCRHYDFLKGAEVYKRRIGGKETPLYRCMAEIQI